MKQKPNKHGLGRYIPAKTAREIRQRSKFGCVICRQAFVEYEHIDPTFENATEHNPENMGLLCPSHHGQVTNGQLSKAAIKAAYRVIQNQTDDEAGPPIGPLDFHDGSSSLVIGGLSYAQTVCCLLRINGIDYITMEPGTEGFPGKISAIFTDDNGEEALKLTGNVFEGSTGMWDIESVGNRLTVRRGKRDIVFVMRLEPPGKVVVEHLDMRVGDVHILANEQMFAVGRRIMADKIFWVTADIQISRSWGKGAVIEIMNPEELYSRAKKFARIVRVRPRLRICGDKNYVEFVTTGDPECLNWATMCELATADRMAIVNSYLGAAFMRVGIVISSRCGDFRWGLMATGVSTLEEVRRSIRIDQTTLARTISSSKSD